MVRRSTICMVLKILTLARRGDRYGNDYSVGVVSHIPQSYDGSFIVSTHEWRRPRTNLIEINSLPAFVARLRDLAMPNLSFVHQSNGLARFAYGSDVENKLVLSVSTKSVRTGIGMYRNSVASIHR